MSENDKPYLDPGRQELFEKLQDTRKFIQTLDENSIKFNRDLLEHTLSWLKKEKPHFRGSNRIAAGQLITAIENLLK